jgi:glycerol-3-phosphate dehydrogenase
MTHSPDLTSGRRARELEALAAGEAVDLVVIGGGITGCGVALDAASRGLSVALLEREDLAWGTSRFSSKLVHGGLRYLAQGQFGVAAESARERHHLMTTIAPHLVHPLATVIPFNDSISGKKRAITRVGYKLGDVLRSRAGTSRDVLGRSKTIDREETLTRVPGLSSDNLDGALIGWDGRLEDDARLVTAVARTAAAHGARILTRCAVSSVERGRVTAEDALTGQSFEIDAANTIAATGVWADELAGDVHLTPSKGSHIIVPAAALGNPTGSLTVPAQGGGAQYVFAIPTAEESVMIGLTDIEFDGDLSSPPKAEEWEIDLLLQTVSSALATPLSRSDVIGSFAGLRPLLRPEGDAGSTADVSREHALLEDAESGMLTIVGGKLTTYRQMAQDAVDRITSRACVTKTLALVGADGAEATDRAFPPRLIRRFGAEAPRVAALAEGDASLLEPITGGSEICVAELRFAAARELAIKPEDILDRRTRAGLTPALRSQLEGATDQALDWALNHPEGVADEQRAASN